MRKTVKLKVKIASWTMEAITAFRKDTEKGSDTYSLRLFDEELLRFSMSNEGLSGLTVRLQSVNRRRKKSSAP